MEKLQLLESVLGQSTKANRDYVQFHCPFCNHYKKKLGISLNTGRWKCWVCPSKGKSISTLFKKIRQPEKIITTAKQLWSEKQTSREEFTQLLTLPKEFKPLWVNSSDFFHTKALKYLQSRGLTIYDIKKHRIGFCSEGRYEDMIIVPSYDKNGMLNFYIARSFTQKQFLVPPNIDKSSVILDENQIDFTEPIVIVESMFDAITVKRNCIPLGGKQISRKLFQRIVEERPPKITICLDGDAYDDSVRLGREFTKQGLNVYIAKIPIGQDPNSLGFNVIWKHINEADMLTESLAFEFTFKERLN